MTKIGEFGQKKLEEALTMCTVHLTHIRSEERRVGKECTG